jgi:hypothetical protein
VLLSTGPATVVAPDLAVTWYWTDPADVVNCTESIAFVTGEPDVVKLQTGLVLR